MNLDDDIVTLLRKYQPYSKLHGQAADEIERLRQVGDKLAMHLDAFFGMLEPASNEITEVLKEWRET